MVARIRKGARTHLYITEWREARGLTLDQLANRVGVAENTIWRWENEQHRLNPEKIAALAHHLDLEPQELWFPPPGGPTRPSLDSLLRGADDDLFSTAHDIISRLARKSG
jgi:transcriptional regulator with XRE-family HTH domain